MIGYVFLVAYRPNIVIDYDGENKVTLNVLGKCSEESEWTDLELEVMKKINVER